MTRIVVDTETMAFMVEFMGWRAAKSLLQAELLQETILFKLQQPGFLPVSSGAPSASEYK